MQEADRKHREGEREREKGLDSILGCVQTIRLPAHSFGMSAFQ